MKQKGYTLITMAAIFWATLGLFVSNLIDTGLSPEQIAFCRLFVGFSILALYSAIKEPQNLKIKKKPLLYSILIGLVCQACFNTFYFNAIDSVGVSVAAVLLYTSPLFLALFSNIFYKEKIDRYKGISLLICFIGSIIAVTGGKLDIDGLNFVGIILGVASAITYAFMPIFSKDALKNCESITLITYGFLFGSIFMIPVAKPLEIIPYLGNIKALTFAICIGLIPAALAYICYLKGIETGLDLSIVGVISSIELVVSAIIGWTIVGEEFSFIKLIGVSLMMFSAFIATKSPSEITNETYEFDLNEKALS